MKTKETKQFIHWCILGAIGCGLMAAGDWLLGCIPLQQTDTGLFNRAYYLSGSYGDIELPKEAKEKDPVTRLELLIRRIHEIQQEIPETEETISPEEQAFLEAANEQYEAVGALRNHLRARRTY